MSRNIDSEGKDGDEKHFECHKQRLRLMAGGSRPTLLSFPGAFALSKVLGIQPSGDLSVGSIRSSHFLRWFRVVLRAKSRQEIFGVDVRSLFGGPGRCGLDLETLRQQQAKGQAQHRTSMEKVRDERRKLPLPNLWAAEIARSLGHELNLQQAILLGKALDAA